MKVNDGFNKHRVRIATYNLKNFRSNRDEERGYLIEDVIRTADPDILVLQEVRSEKGLREWLRRTGLDKEYPNVIVSDKGLDKRRKIALLSRYPVKSYRIIDKRFKVNGKTYTFSRAPIEAMIQLAPNFNVKVYAVHLKSKIGGKIAEERRHKEAEILKRMIRRELKENPDAKIVVAGDFNDTANSETLRKFKEIGLGNPREYEELRNSLLEDVGKRISQKVLKNMDKSDPSVRVLAKVLGWLPDIIPGFEKVKVFYNYDAKVSTFRSEDGRYKSTLDHILLSPSLLAHYQLGSYQVFDVPFLSRLASDHSLVSVDLKVK